MLQREQYIIQHNDATRYKHITAPIQHNTTHHNKTDSNAKPFKTVQQNKLFHTLLAPQTNELQSNAKHCKTTEHQTTQHNTKQHEAI